MLCFHALISLVFAAMIQGDGSLKAAPDADLQVRIVPTSFVENGRAIDVRGPSQHFHVVVTNLSKAPVRLWRDRCSWGYYTVSFRFTDESGKTVAVKKRPRGWDSNAPDWTIVPPGGHMIFEVSFDDKIWQDAPALLPETPHGRRIKMKAVYSVEVDPQSQRRGVWTGEVSSPEEDYTIYR